MPIGLVLSSVLSLQFGGAVAALLFPHAGVGGVVALRLTIAALLMLAVCRPRFRGYGRADWLLVGGFGVALAGLNTLFYHAIDRIPIGPAVTLEVLGPLTLSVLTSRRAGGWLWAGLALCGVALLGRAGFGRLDPIGVAFALAAGAMWAAYIVFSARVGRRFHRADGLTLSMLIAALLTLPFGVHAFTSPSNLAWGTMVALLASVLPYTLEMLALRRLPTSTFAVLMSLGPVAASLAGFLLLDQHLAALEIFAIALVVTANIAAVLTTTRPPAPRVPSPADRRPLSGRRSSRIRTDS
ncbi:EamA family transporter [Actinoplanes sp. NPDC051851]|uniref:EamA family transporter n=1 Tax=Actinoplanes sp. NPDC051851 TaxID=3154753 RepID=UPI003418E3DC